MTVGIREGEWGREAAVLYKDAAVLQDCVYTGKCAMQNTDLKRLRLHIDFFKL